MNAQVKKHYNDHPQMTRAHPSEQLDASLVWVVLLLVEKLPRISH